MNNLRKQVILEKLAKLTSPIKKLLKEHKLLNMVNKGTGLRGDTMHVDRIAATGMSPKDINRTMAHVYGKRAKPHFREAHQEAARLVDPRVKHMSNVESTIHKPIPQMHLEAAQARANVGRSLKKGPGKDKIKTVSDVKRRLKRIDTAEPGRRYSGELERWV